MRIHLNWGGKRRPEIDENKNGIPTSGMYVFSTDYNYDLSIVVEKYIKFHCFGWLYSLPVVELGCGSLVQLTQLHEIRNPGYGCYGYLIVGLRVLKGHPTIHSLKTALGYEIANPNWIEIIQYPR